MNKRENKQCFGNTYIYYSVNDTNTVYIRSFGNFIADVINIMIEF